jgi:hypothetical protein
LLGDYGLSCERTSYSWQRGNGDTVRNVRVSWGDG